MGKSALDAKRKEIFMIEPERLTLVTDKDHPLYDARVNDPPQENMVRSIMKDGIIEPVIIRKNGKDIIEVVAGRGRVKAAIEANKRLIESGKQPLFVPVMLRGGSDADAVGVMISENFIRRDDTVLNKGKMAQKLINMGYTVSDIATVFGSTYQAVNLWLKADELPQEIKQGIEQKEISATAAVAMSDLPRKEQVVKFNEMKESGVKPTIKAVQDKPKMKTRKEIEREISNVQPIEEFNEGYISALQWVLGL